MFCSILCIPDQKQHQLSEDAALVLFDNTCLWLWMREKMVTAFPGETVDKHDKLWQEGFLTCWFMIKFTLR